MRVRYGWAAAGWPAYGGPGPVLAARYGAARGERPAPWVVNSYRLRLPDPPAGRPGGWAYVAEPWSVSARVRSDIAALAEAGFAVEVSAERARHAPGRTIAILITPPGA